MNSSITKSLVIPIFESLGAYVLFTIGVVIKLNLVNEVDDVCLLAIHMLKKVGRYLT